MLPGGRGEEPDEEEKNWPGVGMGGGNRRAIAACSRPPLDHWSARGGWGMGCHWWMGHRWMKIFIVLLLFFVGFL